MKSYIATFEEKNAPFYRNTIGCMWFSGDNIKDAKAKARRYARQSKLKFMSIRLVK